MNKVLDVELDSLKILNDKVLVTELDFGEKKLASGLILSDDDGQFWGIRPRWARVCKVGPDQTELKPGDYILLRHGRWTRAINVISNGQKEKVFMIDFPEGIILCSSERPTELDIRIG